LCPKKKSALKDYLRLFALDGECVACDPASVASSRALYANVQIVVYKERSSSDWGVQPGLRPEPAAAQLRLLLSGRDGCAHRLLAPTYPFASVPPHPEVSLRITT